MLSTGHDMAVTFACLAHEMCLEFLEFVGDHTLKSRIMRSGVRYVIFTCTLFGLCASRNGLGGGFLQCH